MSTTATASAIFCLPIDSVWDVIRDFRWPKKLLSSVIQSVEIEGSDSKESTVVGTVRKLKWKTGETRTHRLIHLSDQYHTVSWELVEAEPPTEAVAIISTLRLYRITETNSTLVEWSAEYSNGTPNSLILFDQKSWRENLTEMRLKLMIDREGEHSIGRLYHVHEAPSTRVIWLSHELGFPLIVNPVSPSSSVSSATNSPSLRKSTGSSSSSSLRRSVSMEMPSSRGGLITYYIDGQVPSVVLLESGAIVMYLLEKWDKLNALGTPPKAGNDEQSNVKRAEWLKYMFYSSSTMDHLLMSTYKLLFVDTPPQDVDEDDEIAMERESTLLENRIQWDDIAVELSKAFQRGKDQKYLCGDKFTAVDIMVGWSLYCANLFGWLEEHPILKSYFQRLSSRTAFQQSFSS